MQHLTNRYRYCLKMKIKRSKNRHNEAGKLEIVPNQGQAAGATAATGSQTAAGTSSNHSDQSVAINGGEGSSAGGSSSIPLSAAEIIEAAKKANGSNVQGGKIRINSKANGQAKTDKAGAKHKAKDSKGPNAKKQKVGLTTHLLHILINWLQFLESKYP